MSNYQMTDGGRKDAGFFNEFNDCVVRAFTIAYDILYEDAHALLKSYGRKDNEAVVTRMCMNKFNNFIWEKRQPQIKRSVQGFLKDYPKGRYIIRVEGHAMAVVDGILYDESNSNMRRHVKRAWKIS